MGGEHPGYRRLGGHLIIDVVQSRPEPGHGLGVRGGEGLVAQCWLRAGCELCQRQRHGAVPGRAGGARGLKQGRIGYDGLIDGHVPRISAREQTGTGAALKVETGAVQGVGLRDQICRQSVEVALQGEQFAVAGVHDSHQGAARQTVRHPRQHIVERLGPHLELARDRIRRGLEQVDHAVAGNERLAADRGHVHAAVRRRAAGIIQVMRQVLQFLLAQIAQGVGRAAGNILRVGNLIIQVGDVREQLVGRADLAVERIIQPLVHGGKPRADLLKCGGERLRRADHRLPRGQGGGRRGDGLQRLEKPADLVGQAGARRRAAGGPGAGGTRAEKFVERVLRIFQGALLRVRVTGLAGLVLNLAVEHRVHHLLDGQHAGSGALRADAGLDLRVGLDDDPLARVAGGVDVGQVLARHFHARHLRLQ